MEEWNVGVYIRLSQEDGDKEESNSIINQRELINDFISETNDLRIYDYYIDDGWSGTNFDRPSFKKMINDIENNIINTIIVKDLSRFGRNYIEVGNYLEQIFPLKNIRFIAINDCIDSYKDPESINSIIVPFKNLMNDEYCRDISQKVKYALNTRKKNGEYMGSIVPYGYKRSEEDKHKLIVDKESADVVKMIFSIALKGIGTTTIARTLNKKNIPTPSVYKRDIQKIKCSFRNGNKNTAWSDSNVSSILRNRLYLGEMIQNKYRKVSYKIQKSVKNKKEDWTIVTGTHEALVSYKDFDKIQAMMDSRGWRCNMNGTVSMFAGLIKCGDCKASMTKNTSGTKRKDGTAISYYYCGTYIRQSKDLCTKHSTKVEIVEDIVFNAVKNQVALILDYEKVMKKIYEENSNNEKKKEYLKIVEEFKEKLKQMQVLKSEAYIDWKKEVIKQDEYFSFVEQYSKQINELNKQIIEYQNMANGIKDESITDYIYKYRKYKNIKKLDREIITELINCIYIYENSNIVIDFKYDDIYKKILEQVGEVKNNEQYNI